MASTIIHGLRLFLFILQEVHCLNMTMHYTHSGTISLYQISCLNVLPLVSYAFSSGRSSVGR